MARALLAGLAASDDPGPRIVGAPEGGRAVEAGAGTHRLRGMRCPARCGHEPMAGLRLPRRALLDPRSFPDLHFHVHGSIFPWVDPIDYPGVYFVDVYRMDFSMLFSITKRLPIRQSHNFSLTRGRGCRRTGLAKATNTA